MTINLSAPGLTELKPRIVVIGVGGAGGNAVNNMIESGLDGVEFIVANTDAQALAHSKADRLIQLGASITQGLGCGAQPEIGRAAAEEALEEILDHMSGTHMAFITAGMGGGTGTGAAPVIAECFREQGILTVGVVTKPFQFEGARRLAIAEQGIDELQHFVDTLIVIPNQNLFRIANEKTTFADAFTMADNVLHSGVRGITDLMVMPGLINLDFADVRTVMGEMGKAMMGTGEADGDKRAVNAAESAISNPLLDEVSMKGARGVLINITGGMDLTLYEVDEAANRIREEVDPNANIIVGSALDEVLNGAIRVSVVATGIDLAEAAARPPVRPQLATVGGRQAASQERPVPDAAETAKVAPAAPVANRTAERPAEPAVARPPVEAPRISEIMSRLEATRRAVPKAKPIEPEPQPLAGKPVAEEQVSDEPFIAPAAAAPGAAVEPEPVPQPGVPVLQEPTPAPAVAPRKSRLSLFARMTGGAKAAPSETPAASQPGLREPSFGRRAAAGEETVSEAEVEEDPGRETQAAVVEPASSEAAVPAEPKAPQESASEDEDLLDIPSFLRRQAN